MNTMALIVAGLTLWQAGDSGDSQPETSQYRDPAFHFAVSLPPEWELLPASTLEAVNGSVQEPVKYSAGFQLKGQDEFTYPYILVQTQALTLHGATYDQIEREFNKGAQSEIQKMQGESNGLGKMSADYITVDRLTNRVTIPTIVQVEGEGMVRGWSVGEFGSDGIVFLHCYARQEDFDTWMPTFSWITDTCHFDRGFAFQPVYRGDPAAIFARIAAGVVTVVGVWVLSRLRKK